MKKLIFLSLFALVLIGMVFAQADPRTIYQELILSPGAPVPTTAYAVNDPHYLIRATDSGSGVTWGSDSPMPQMSYFFVWDSIADFGVYAVSFDQAAWAVPWAAGATLTLKIWWRADTGVPFNEATDPYVQKTITVPAGVDPIYLLPTLGFGDPSDILVIPPPPVTAETYTLHITSSVPGTILTNPTPYDFTGTTAAELYGSYAMDVLAGGVWDGPYVVDAATVWTEVTTGNFAATLHFTWTEDPIPDTYLYTLSVNSTPANQTVTGPTLATGGVTNYFVTSTTEGAPDLLGTYTIAPPDDVEHFWWTVDGVVTNQAVVTLQDFAPVQKKGSKDLLAYEAEILFELMEEEQYTLTFTVTPATAQINGADILVFTGYDDQLIGTYEITAPGYISQTYTLTAITADMEVAIVLVPVVVDFTYFVESHAYDAVNDILLPGDINAEILFNGASFPIPIYTPYTFGLPGNYPFIAGVYSVTHPLYEDWQPISITFDTITGSTATDFWAIISETVPVELSSFTATLTSNLYVTLTWVSQSETNLTGYRVYRNTSNDQASAELIDHPFVPAHNTSTTQVYNVTDQGVTVGTYYYWLESVEYNTSDFHGPVSVTVENNNTPPVLPQTTVMKSAYPNPFRTGGSTNIDVTLKAGDNGTVTIYNILGQVVRTYSVREGNNTITWNGKDSRGNACGNGIYFYKLSTTNFNETKKMVIVK